MKNLTSTNISISKINKGISVIKQLRHSLAQKSLITILANKCKQQNQWLPKKNLALSATKQNFRVLSKNTR